MKAVAYYRVSTSAQGRSGLGLDAQRTAIQDLAAQRGMSLLAEFTEVESGQRNDRPELHEALRHARLTGAILVIAKLDRLSRNAAFLLTLRDSGVKFLAADVPDANDITIGVLAVIAQAEREAISRRTREALGSIKKRLDAGEIHMSKRSGRCIQRLGNPSGAAAFGPLAGCTRRATQANVFRAQQRAADLKPIIDELTRLGVTSPSAIARAMDARGITTVRGGPWSASSVRRLTAQISGAMPARLDVSAQAAQ